MAKPSSLTAVTGIDIVSVENVYVHNNLHDVLYQYCNICYTQHDNI